MQQNENIAATDTQTLIMFPNDSDDVHDYNEYFCVHRMTKQKPFQRPVITAMFSVI